MFERDAYIVRLSPHPVFYTLPTGRGMTYRIFYGQFSLSHSWGRTLP
jgi:hypothetical protein